MKRLAMILALLGGAAWGQNESGNGIYAACTDSASVPTVQTGYCIGYISGAWEGIKIGAALSIIGSGSATSSEDVERLSNILLGVCLPSEAEKGQIAAVFLKYLDEHPETRHESARLLLRQSLSEAFPCL